MNINIIKLILITTVILFSQDKSFNPENSTFIDETFNSVEIETNDGNILLGQLIEETDNYYKLLTLDGISIELPKSKVKEIQIIETLVRSGSVFRADPNSSMYFFAPSAFPIGDNSKYCRSFCLVFPSYNRGFGDNISIQAGAFVFPSIEFDMVPLVLSGKYSFPSLIFKNKMKMAAGAMYISMPVDQGESISSGIAFVTSTIGNNFTHASFALGWGFVSEDAEWDFSSDLMLNFAGNYRLNNSLGILGEFWMFPEIDIVDAPIMLASRFIGRKLSVDLGFITTLQMFNEGVPFPLLNFTYHFKD